MTIFLPDNVFLLNQVLQSVKSELYNQLHLIRTGIVCADIEKLCSNILFAFILYGFLLNYQNLA